MRMTVVDTSIMQERIGELCGQFKLPTVGAVPRQPYLPVGVNQFCRFTSSAWTRCWAALPSAPRTCASPRHRYKRK